jgi:hypothetical protein
MNTKSPSSLAERLFSSTAAPEHQVTFLLVLAEQLFPITATSRLMPNKSLYFLKLFHDFEKNFLLIFCKFIDANYAGVLGLCYMTASLHHHFLKDKFRSQLVFVNLHRSAFGTTPREHVPV